jgi:hypothetical protein
MVGLTQQLATQTGFHNMVSHFVVVDGLHIGLGFVGAHSVKRDGDDLALTEG